MFHKEYYLKTILHVEQSQHLVSLMFSSLKVFVRDPVFISTCLLEQQHTVGIAALLAGLQARLTPRNDRTKDINVYS